MHSRAHDDLMVNSQRGIDAAILLVSFVAGVINSFHSRNVSQATAFMTGRIATIGTQLGLKLRSSSTFNSNKLMRNIASYVFFFAGGMSIRALSTLSLEISLIPFHTKFVVEMVVLFSCYITSQDFPRVAYKEKTIICTT